MRKKRTAKDQARYYTTVLRTRPPSPEKSRDSVKDVTTQLRELRIEQARERQLSQQSKMTADSPLPFVSSLGFAPANYTVDDCPRETQRARRIPGPPPPRSWIERRPNKQRRTQNLETTPSRAEPIPSFPDYERPCPRSLLHHTLLSLGRYFHYHQETNKYYLPQLSIQIKEWLLTYIAAKNSGGAITKEGLDTLFPLSPTKDDPEEMHNVVILSRKDEVYVRYLDLSDALGSNLSIAQLQTFLCPTEPPPSPPASLEWQISTRRFPNLTHLSLDISSAYTPKLDHNKLVHLLSHHCSRLTHLSIAGVFNTVISAGSLIRLSRELVCLEHIGLSRTPMLFGPYGNDHFEGWNDEAFNWDGARLLERLNWEGAWRKVRTLVIKECGFTKNQEKDVLDIILRKRRGNGRIEVIIE